MKKTVRARAPLRLGIAGGGTDVAPYCDEYGGMVLNATINMYAYAVIELTSDNKITFVATDQHQTFESELTDHLEPTGELVLHKGVYNRIIKEFNKGQPLAMRVTTYADAPAGSGLGSSSTIMVAIIKAFVELLHLPLGEYDIAHLAYEIERLELGLHGGKQDQYAATFGGFNFMEFYNADRVIVNPLRIKNWVISELEASLILFYTGTSRESAKIIKEQISNVTHKNAQSIHALHELKEQAFFMKECLLKGDIPRLANALDESWNAKKQLAGSITNQSIDEVYAVAKKAGALAGKISGAGGGGFMMFIVDPVHKMQVIQVLRERFGNVMNCHFTHEGTQGWRIY